MEGLNVGKQSLQLASPKQKMAQTVVAVVRNGEQNTIFDDECAGAGGGDGYGSTAVLKVVTMAVL